MLADGKDGSWVNEMVEHIEQVLSPLVYAETYGMNILLSAWNYYSVAIVGYVYLETVKLSSFL